MFTLFNKKKNDLISVCSAILKQNTIKHTGVHLKDLLESHSDYPSLLAIKDALEEYGVQSAAIRKQDYDYSDFQTPFISSIQKEDWPHPFFTVVTEAEPSGVQYLDPHSHKYTKESLADFSDMDKGIILLLDPETKRDETDFAANRRKERVSKTVSLSPLGVGFLTLISSIIFIIVNYSGWIGWTALSFLLTGTVGLAVSVLLLWHEIDSHNPFLKEVCGGQGRKISCDAVLGSNGARFLGISWSLWGFAYFVAFFLTFTLFIGQIQFLSTWIWISIAATPYIIYSLYYQWRIIKQWCPLCLSVQVILGINAVISLVIYSQGEMLPLQGYALLIIVLLGLGGLLLGYYSVPLIKRSKDSRSYERKWKRMRYNPEIFKYLQKKSHPIHVPYDGLGIVLGNPEAMNEIIKVCNPYCGPCSRAHPLLEEIVTRNPDVKLRIIFTATGKKDDLKTRAVKLFLAVRDKYGKTKLEELLNRWYGAESVYVEKLEEEYNANGNDQDYTKEIEAMKLWCDAMKIRATPTLYINGYELHESYRIEELKNFL